MIQSYFIYENITNEITYDHYTQTNICLEGSKTPEQRGSSVLACYKLPLRLQRLADRYDPPELLQENSSRVKSERHPKLRIDGTKANSLVGRDASCSSDDLSKVEMDDIKPRKTPTEGHQRKSPLICL